MRNPSLAHGGAVSEPSLTGAGDAGPENGGVGRCHNQGPAHTPAQPAGLGLLCWIWRLLMRNAVSHRSRGWVRVKIRGAGGVKNRLFPPFFAVKRCLRLAFHLWSAAVPGPQGGAVRRRKRHIAPQAVMLYRLIPCPPRAPLFRSLQHCRSRLDACFLAAPEGRPGVAPWLCRGSSPARTSKLQARDFIS